VGEGSWNQTEVKRKIMESLFRGSFGEIPERATNQGQSGYYISFRLFDEIVRKFKTCTLIVIISIIISISCIIVSIPSLIENFTLLAFSILSIAMSIIAIAAIPSAEKPPEKNEEVIDSISPESLGDAHKRRTALAMLAQLPKN